GDVGSGEFFHVALVGREIGDGGVVGFTSNFLAATAADGRVGIIVDFASGEIRHVRIEQARKRAQDAAFGLAAQPQQNEIVAGENGVDDLGNDGVFVADDPRKDDVI